MISRHTLNSWWIICSEYCELQFLKKYFFILLRTRFFPFFRNSHLNGNGDETDADRNVYKVINEVIENDIKTDHKTDIKKKLGTELIETLDQMEFNCYFESSSAFDEQTRGSYEKLRHSLGFQLIEIKQ